MFRSLFKRIAAAKPAASSKSSSPRRARLAVESLEGRAVPSASPAFAHATTADFAQASNLGLHLPPIFFHRAPDLRGLDFHLISSNGKPAHDLKIETEHFSFFGHASFTGEWIGDKNGGVNPVTDGSLQYTGPGRASMSFSWNGAHYFNGNVTWVAPSFTHFHLRPGHWHLEGDVTVPGNPGGGPGHVAGDAYLPLLLHA
jgi:hypothetical protein